MSTANHSTDIDVICVNCGKRIEWWICTTPQGPMHRSCFDLFYAIVPSYLPISGCFDKFVVKTKFTLDHYLLNTVNVSMGTSKIYFELVEKYLSSYW